MYKLIRIDQSRWQDLKLLRLHALIGSPQFFSTSYNAEALISKSEWIKRVTSSSTAYCICYFNEIPIAMGRVTKTNNSIAELGSLFVEKPHRGKGISKDLVKFRLELAKNEFKVKYVQVEIVKSNKVAFNLYKGFGFKIVRDNLDEYTMSKEL